jgi:Host cell surface-exposed lipoprotein
LSSQYGEGYSKADATFAVDYLKVNWKAQAVRSAKDYLAMDHFSRAGLIQQLSSVYGDGYTRAEATYAADQIGL